MPTLRVPYLRVPCFVGDGEVRFAATRHKLGGAGEAAVLRAVFRSEATTEDLAALLVAQALEPDLESANLRLQAIFKDQNGVLGEVEITVPEKVDVILIEQGYGGVYVHTVELMKQLRKRWSCLLLSPVPPLFEPAPMPDVLSLEGLRKTDPDLPYFAWVQILRTIVQKVACRLLLIMHRSQSLYLFDLLRLRPTVIYCDGFYDGAFRRVQDFHLDESPERRDEVLAELHYLIANGPSRFHGMSATPSVNVKLLMAGSYSLTAAVENWCWGKEQHANFAGEFPGLRDRIRMMLPFTNPELFERAAVHRQRKVLFTTTMHNIDQKGYPELAKAMELLPRVEARVVVRQPHLLPKVPAKVTRRMVTGPVSKPEMIGLYHTLWLNCRVSRQESSPLSILESMVCEMPQIISTTVAEQIPILEDGATGFVIDPDDNERLRWALTTLLGDDRLRDRMGREARRRAIALSFDRRVHEFERLLG